MINAGIVTVNTETINEQNAADTTMDQTNPSSAPQLLCSEVADRAPNVQISAVDVSQATGLSASLLNPPAPKVPEAVNNDSELSADSVD